MIPVLKYGNCNIQQKSNFDGVISETRTLDNLLTLQKNLGFNLSLETSQIILDLPPHISITTPPYESAKNIEAITILRVITVLEHA